MRINCKLNLKQLAWLRVLSEVWHYHDCYTFILTYFLGFQQETVATEMDYKWQRKSVWYYSIIHKQQK